MYQFYPKISKINEKVNTIFISPEKLRLILALNKRDAGQGVVFRVWLFSCNDSMSLAGRKWFLRLRPDFTSKLVHVLAFGTPKFYIAPYDKIKHELVNLSSNCDVKSGLNVIFRLQSNVQRICRR